MKKLVRRSNERTYGSKDSLESVEDRASECHQRFESFEEKASLWRKVCAYFFFHFYSQFLTVGERLSQKASCVFMRETPSGS